MYINVSEIAKDSGASFAFHYDAFEGNFTETDESVKVKEPMCVSGTVMNAGAYFLVKGKAKANLKLVCGSCLELYDLPFEFELNVRVAEHDMDDECEYYILENQRINLSQIVYEQLYLQLPIERKCKPDCKGLCCNCGHNLNHSMCSCNQDTEEIEEPSTNPFLKLKNMFTDEEV